MFQKKIIYRCDLYVTACTIFLYHESFWRKSIEFGLNFMRSGGYIRLITTQLVKKSSRFMELEGSLPCPQGPATGPYSEPD